MPIAAKGIIFDNDGVLVDSERLSNQVLAEMVSALGAPLTFDEAVRRYMGRRNSDCLRDIAELIGREVPAEFLPDFEERCAELLRSELVAIDGVIELLDSVDAAGLPRCIASSGTPEEIALRLETTGLVGHFDGNVYSGTQVPHGKPAPDLFLFAAERMGLDPAETVVVEDSPAGITGAKAAGMRVIGHANLLPPERLTAAGADHTVTTMRQVAGVLGL